MERARDTERGRPREAVDAAPLQRFEDPVDEVIAESFPASDPPQWWCGAAAQKEEPRADAKRE